MSASDEVRVYREQPPLTHDFEVWTEHGPARVEIEMVPKPEADAAVAALEKELATVLELNGNSGLDLMEEAGKRRQLEHELDELAALVREWLCENCNTVYPGPPQPGFRCVICPRCGGATGPKEAVLLRRETLRAEKAEAELAYTLKVMRDGGCRDCDDLADELAETRAELQRLREWTVTVAIMEVPAVEKRRKLLADLDAQKGTT